MKYVGVKILLSAVEMSRLQYVTFRGWELPEGEDPDERVYLVEYEPSADNKPNHKDYKGYITMSPKNVFEEAYVELAEGWFGFHFEQAHEYRVQEEAKELTNKLTALHAMMGSGFFLELDEVQQIRLTKQSMAMRCYLSVLVSRMQSFKQVAEIDAYIPKLTFGAATALAKKGRPVARIGWNGADMFAFIEPEYQTTVADILDWEKEVGSTALTGHYVGDFAHTTAEAEEGKGPDSVEVTMRATWKLKTADGSIATWAPSGSDSLAVDWIEVKH